MSDKKDKPHTQISPPTFEVLNDPSALALVEPDELMGILNRRNLFMDAIRDAGIRSTWSEQWCNMDGKPWPSAPCAETIARRCAVRVHSTSYKRENSSDDEGDFYFYVYTGTVELPGHIDSVDVPGTCSSRDQFLGTRAGGGRQLSEINEDDIMKAAYSNMLVNGIMRLLGLRGLSWERLKEFGLDPDKAVKIEHQKGGRGGSTRLPFPERPLPFGRSKGKKLSEADEGDLSWILPRFEESAEDPEKAKYREDNLGWVAAIKEEFARRANLKAGIGGNGTAGAAAAGAAKPGPWERILALPGAKGMPPDDLKTMVKQATGKKNSGELDDADVTKVQAVLGKRKPRPEDNINFD